MLTEEQFELRRRHYGIDEPAQEALRRVWPLVASCLDAAIDENMRAASRLPPPIGPLMQERGPQIAQLTRDHMPILFQIGSGRGWMDSTNKLSQAELALGLDARHRAGVNRYILSAVLPLIGRHHRLNGPAVARLGDAVGRLLLLDVSCAVIFHSNEQCRVAEARGAHLERAIREFDTAASGMRSGTQELVASLSQTSGHLTDFVQAADADMMAAIAASAGATETAAQTADSTEELSNSIAEIGEHVRRSVEIAGRAVSDTERTNANISALVNAVGKVGSVVGLIAEIAAQTNLLALNATIEAARAGEAGRGFSVVASEVKSLAAQTARATDEIREHIESIQEATRRSVDEIGVIGGAVADMQASATTIAAAVHQQSLATRHIAEGADSTSRHVSALTHAVTTVEGAMCRAGQTAKTVLDVSHVLARRTGELDDAMTVLFQRVRAG